MFARTHPFAVEDSPRWSGRCAPSWAALSRPVKPGGPAARRTGALLAGEDGEPLTVWVVEDDTVVALYLGELLSEHGFAVTTFVDARFALRTFESHPERVDVVITDQRMPGLAGDVLAAAILRLRPGTRVILCTGYSDVIDEQRALALGVHRFFRKPFDAQALLRAVRGGDSH